VAYAMKSDHLFHRRGGTKSLNSILKAPYQVTETDGIRMK